MTAAVLRHRFSFFFMWAARCAAEGYMRRELDHFYIGKSYGGNQEWFRTFMMRLGGCGAETACDSSIYFAREFGVRGIYPHDADRLSKADYVDFAHRMEKYLWPRRSGINRLETYIDGYSRYLRDAGVFGLSMDGFSGNASTERACEALKSQIDRGLLIPNLTLRHGNRRFRDYVWHWYILNGYDEREDGMYVKAVTYSGWEWLNFAELWDTGSLERGGMILFDMN